MGVFSFLYIQNISLFDKINSKLIDQFFEIRGEVSVDDKIVIVDIDDETLKHINFLSPNHITKIINNISDANPKVIALCEIFPSFTIDKDMLKDTLVSGYMFSFNKKIKRGKLPEQNYIVIEKNYRNFDFIPVAKGYIANGLRLKNGVNPSGFLNIFLDDDGVVRSFPLVARYEDMVYLSLPLEVVRYIKGVGKIEIKYSKIGIDEIKVGDLSLQTDRFGREVLNYKKESKGYRYISAIRILENSFEKKVLQNKIVLIGSTSLGKDSYSVPIDVTFPQVEIVANAIDNMLNQDFLIKPNWLEGIDIGVLLMVLLLVFGFSFLSIIYSGLLFVLLVFGYLYIAFLLFVNNGIILNIISVLLSSFLLYMILTVLDYIFDLKQKKKLQEKLIEELKNRHSIVEKEVFEKTKEVQKALREKSILLRELHHRVKNNLQLILSITRLQQSISKDIQVKKELEKLQGRIKSIAKTHEILCDNDDISSVNMDEYIGSLCEEIENSLIYDSIEINLNINEVYLPLREAIYVGLVINELITNSIKHSKEAKIKNIYIKLYKIEGIFRLIVSDDGLGYDKGEKGCSSLGLKLVDSLVFDQLEGKMEIECEENLKYTIEFKL